VPNAGEQTNFELGDQIGAGRVGDVFRVDTAGTEEYYVLLSDGKQRVTRAVANLIRLEYTADAEIPAARPDLVGQVPNAEGLDVETYPAEIPHVLDAVSGGHQTTCLGWELTGEGPREDGRTTMYIGGELPFPRDDDGNRRRPVSVAKANEEGIAVDYFYMPQGRAAVVHSATGKASFQSGPIQLISDRGMRYGVPNQATAQHLGLVPEKDSIRPAPELIVRLLPTASSLNAQDAMRTFDSLQLDPEASHFEGQDLDPEGAAGG
jgi:hypothetical protein